MNSFYDRQCLEAENAAFRGTAGVSSGNRSRGFLPAFLDLTTGRIFLSRFRDGRLAPCHLLDGLPGELVVRRRADGGVAALKACVQAGFVLAGRFYSRAEAAAAV